MKNKQNQSINFRNLYYKGRCLSVSGHSDVPTLTSPPVLMLWGTQGYLWLPYDLTEVIKLFGERFEPKIYFFFQENTLCHSFRIIVISSGLPSFLPDFCQSFRIFVIISRLVSFNSVRILLLFPSYYHLKYLPS